MRACIFECETNEGWTIVPVAVSGRRLLSGFEVVDDAPEPANSLCATARDAAYMYYEGLYRLLGLPDDIVSNRGLQFIADFTDKLAKIRGVK